MLSGIGTIGGALSIVIAAFLGKNAVADFERQKQAERRIEHAEQTLAAAYRLQSAIETIRSPLSTSYELSSSQEELDQLDWFKELPKPKQDRAVQANVFYIRIRQFSDWYDAALTALPFAKAYFGIEAEEGLKALIHARHTVRVYADAYSRDDGHDRTHSKKTESFIWQGASEPDQDPIAVKTNQAISQLEAILLPAIKGTKLIKAAKGKANA